MNKATPCPTIPKGTEVAEQLLSVVNNFGKGTKKRSRDVEEDTMWKKKSIFFTLPYWEVLVVHHNLDVMHVEKNICESIINIVVGPVRLAKRGVNWFFVTSNRFTSNQSA